jgi:hypothetical protein
MDDVHPLLRFLYEDSLRIHSQQVESQAELPPFRQGGYCVHSLQLRHDSRPSRRRSLQDHPDKRHLAVLKHACYCLLPQTRLQGTQSGLTEWDVGNINGQSYWE